MRPILLRRAHYLFESWMMKAVKVAESCGLGSKIFSDRLGYSSKGMRPILSRSGYPNTHFILISSIDFVVLHLSSKNKSELELATDISGSVLTTWILTCQ